MTGVGPLPARAGRLLLPALAVLALLLAGCGGASTGATDASPVATTTVDLPASYRFVPAAITVAAGSTVTWTNHDNFTHNVSFDGAEPLPMAPGESATHTFPTAGRFAYVCSLHPRDMKGSVLVTGA
jgi:plastocyanin